MLTSAQNPKAVQKLFDRFDTNGDGMLSFDEVRELCECVCVCVCVCVCACMCLRLEWWIGACCLMRLAKHVYSGKGRKRPRLLLTRTHSSRRAVQQSSKAILPYQKNKAAYRRRTTQNCPVITIVESGLLLVRAIVQNRICQRNVRDFVYLCWNMTCPYVEQPNSVQP